MNTGLFKKLCDVWAVPVQYRGDTRESRLNPALFTPAYEEVQDLTIMPDAKGLVLWQQMCSSIYAPNGQTHKASRQSLIFFLAKRAARKAGDKDVQKFLADATSKADNFIAHYERCKLRGISLHTRIISFQPNASPVQEAIMALHKGDLATVKDFFLCYIEGKTTGDEDDAARYAREMGENLPDVVSFIEVEHLANSTSGDEEAMAETDADGDSEDDDRLLDPFAGTMVVTDPKERALMLLEKGLPISETLDFLENIEYSEMKKLPEFIGVSRFKLLEQNPEISMVPRGKAMFPKNTLASHNLVERRDPDTGKAFMGPPVWDSSMTGGKTELPDGQIIDCDGLYVKPDLWDSELTEGNDLAHSPSQERAEEREIQAYFRAREDRMTAEMHKRIEKLHQDGPQQQALQASDKLSSWREACRKAREEAMRSGKTVCVSVA